MKALGQIFVLAVGICTGILMADGIKLAIGTYTAKAALEAFNEKKARQKAEAARHAEIRRKKEAAENARRMKEQERKRAEYKIKKSSFQKRNTVIEAKNNYLLQLKTDCDDAHERIRTHPSRENTVIADEACTDYLLEKDRLSKSP